MQGCSCCRRLFSDEGPGILPWILTGCSRHGEFCWDVRAIVPYGGVDGDRGRQHGPNASDGKERLNQTAHEAGDQAIRSSGGTLSITLLDSKRMLYILTSLLYTKSTIRMFRIETLR
jgi:hypothetical protein